MAGRRHDPPAAVVGSPIVSASVLTIVARALHTVALSLWLGGLVAIGALVAPTAFHLTRSLPAFAGNTALQNAIAGGVVGGSLKLFVVLCYVCGVLLLLTGAVLLRTTPRRPALAYLVVSALLLLSALYLGLSLTPALDAAQARSDFATFDGLHHQYEQRFVAGPDAAAFAAGRAGGVAGWTYLPCFAGSSLKGGLGCGVGALLAAPSCLFRICPYPPFREDPAKQGR